MHGAGADGVGLFRSDYLYLNRDTLPTEDERKAALKTWQQDMRALQQEAAARFVLRALYSPTQLREKMTWFWMNHFNVSTRKGETRMWIGDYEERAVRPNAARSGENSFSTAIIAARMPPLRRMRSNCAGTSTPVPASSARMRSTWERIRSSAFP